ncbi:MAG: hypothetical protein NVS9B1_06510 [Candidatus Dormibacteraceae bacterium]
MSKFKRVSLVGSEELFRPTRPEVIDETDDVITEVLDRRPTEKLLKTLHLTPDELELLLEAVQIAKYPEKGRPHPSLDKFERLDAIRDKLQGD